MYTRPQSQQEVRGLRRLASNLAGKCVNQITFFSIWINDGAKFIWANPWVKYLNGPLTIVVSLFGIILAWHQIRLTEGQGKYHLIWQAFIETLTGAAMIVAAIGVIASITAFALVAPILIAAAFATKTFFNLCSTIYFAYQASKLGEDHDEYRNKAKGALLATLATGFMTAVTITLMVVAAPIVQSIIAGVALTASIIGFVIAIFAVGQHIHSLKVAHTPEFDVSDDEDHIDHQGNNKLTNNARLAEELGVNSATSKQIETVERMLGEPTTESTQQKTVTIKPAVNEPMFDDAATVTASLRN